MRKFDGTTLPALHDYLGARLSREAAEPLNRQLYRALREAIVAGHLERGRALPASRALAEALDLARNTVLHAYAQLCAEGYCSGRGGAGTFVAASMPDAPPLAAAAVAPAGDGVPTLSRRGQALLDTLALRSEPAGPAFAPGLPELAAFPWATWFKLLQRRQRAAAPAEFDYRGAGGRPELRAALADYLRLSRGVNCDAAQVLVTGGMQQTLDLLARTLADPGDTVWMEEPGYLGARTAWQAAGLAIAPVPVDAGGLAWQDRALPPPRLVYVTPSHQYPLGSVLGLERRQALLAEAGRHGAWIVEDDYDSEFRHAGRPLAAMQGLDRAGRVLYLGTFSKVMFPALRLAYLVAPPALVEPLRRLQARLYREGDYATQAALADFIAEGHFGAHLRRMRGIYARRQARLRGTLAAELGDGVRLHGGEAGMHVVLQLRAGSDDRAASTALQAIGLAAPPLSAYCAAEPPFPGLVLGYAGVDDAALMLAAVRLARVLRAMGMV
ncbi:MocR-like pyridoxine biosynthesis transcription factor PdxR [Chitinimonas koreensis]|uniref:MocR-like pyridoxine biosynthesis transcription factor PdxR n=1 Tax=Chitinimonas koreensis TaxID=356302 RepID=UPI0004012AF4|nr:PLP-dependent aminotransferase family protein [Chitinimonas koreensis]QNM96024.1 PLP-dependent aminotransferase family protein [Chitinimonas koreensis]